MITKRFVLQYDPYIPPTVQDLERLVWDFLYEWHAGDGLQEEINMRLREANIPAGVAKVGEPGGGIKFIVQPFPSYYKPTRTPNRRGF
jgi:hypothetical protein